MLTSLTRTIVLTLLLPTVATAQQARSSASAFAIEASGAAVGSFTTAVAAHIAMREIRGPCGVDDLECLIGRLGVLGVASTVGAAAGGYFAGRQAGTAPSGPGSVVGAVLGVAAGVGAAQLLEEMNIRGTWVAGLSYSLAQGLVTAAGSRLFASRR